MHAVRTASSLNFLQWRYLLKSLVLLPLIDLSLRRSGYAATLARLDRLSAVAMVPLENGASNEFGYEIAKVVGIAGRRHFWRTTCLRQALLLRFFLARRGMRSELRIGVKSDSDAGFGAHAWVERNGDILIGGEHARSQYTILR
jgi:Transglutaminase-like superfamily